jgi:nucleoside phosphorylase
MYYEAKPFISYLGLKKDTEVTKFQVFKNDDIALIITGVGMVEASIAVTYLFAKYDVKRLDLFINIGVCGTGKQDIEKESTLLCHKIINHDTKKTFYPDMLFKHPFKEGVLETFSKVVDKDMYLEIEGDIVDMEGAGAYQAASVFLSPEQIYCIKIVSDILEGGSVTPVKISEIIQAQLPKIISWMKERVEFYPKEEDALTENEMRCLAKIVENLRLTTAMRYQLKQLSKHFKIRYGTLIDVIEDFSTVEIKSKNEGKRYFAKLKDKLMEF